MPSPTKDLLTRLPARLDWVVFFRLAAIRRLADDATVRRMFFLADDEALDAWSHVVLSSEGRYLAGTQDGQLCPANGQPHLRLDAAEATMFEVHAARLSSWHIEGADCIGIGGEGEPVALLHVRLVDGVGHAQAYLAGPPPAQGYDLLPAVGVSYLGGQATPHGWLAHYRNRLSAHILAGLLSGFSRTHNCNLFFMRQGRIDDELAGGLANAFRDRLAWARLQASDLVHALAARSISKPLAMTCRNLVTGETSAYGDLVPLGALLRGADAVSASDDARPLMRTVHAQRRTRLRSLLATRRIGVLWPFHTARLPTATDSALVMLGLQGDIVMTALRDLERFGDGEGGVLPQLAADAAGPEHMEVADCNRHWRQADFATTCLVHALRLSNGMAPVTDAAWFRHRFGHRSGLFFANPWLVDWCLALAVRHDPQLASLGNDLLQEVLASANDDGSFGTTDALLSTALAIACMDALGYRGRSLRRAQLALLRSFDPASLPECVPFFSTFIQTPYEAMANALEVLGERHELSVYVDTHGLFLAGCVAMALAVEPEVDESEPLRQPGVAHPRYACPDLPAYLAGFALPPYVAATAATDTPAPTTVG